MKYIKKVNLKNFQSHKNTTLEFDRGLNIIVGASDSGKTSILRAIKWALYNDPAGDYFIREGESECSVTIYFSDKSKIKRYRSKSKNTYLVYDKDDNEIKYEGFGTSVPEEVVNLTGIKKILLDKDNSKAINISDQLEGAFLLSEKNSTKANSIGYLVGVDVIDDALRETLKDSRNLSNQEKLIDNDINKLKEELRQYEYLEEMNIKIKKINEIRNQLNNKSEILDTYKRIADKKIFIDKEKVTVNYFLEKLKDLNKIDLYIQKFELRHNRLKLLSNYNINLEKLQKNKAYNMSLISSLKAIDKLNLNVKKIDDFQIKQYKMSKLNEKFKKHILEKNTIILELSKLKSLNLIADNISKIDKNIVELRNLDELKLKEEKLSKSLDKGKEYLKKLENIDLSMDKYLILNKKMKILFELIGLNSNYVDNKDKKYKCKLYINNNKKDLDNMSVDYKEMLLSQQTCPLCFSKIDNEKADYIISQYK